MGYGESESTAARQRILIAAYGSISDAVTKWVFERYPQCDLFLLNLDPNQDHTPPPAGWKKISVVDLGTMEELRVDFLRYLERIARTPVQGDKTLEDLFRRRDGYSLWWTDAALRRSPTSGVFLKVKTVWAVTRAIAKLRPDHVLCHSQDSRLAGLLFWSSREAQSVVFTPESARPAPFPMAERRSWFRDALKYACQFVGHRLCRWFAMRKHHDDSPGSDEPKIVLSAVYPRQVAGGDNPGVWYWRELADALRERLPEVQTRYVLSMTNMDAYPLNFDFDYIKQAATTLENIPDVVPLWRGHVSIRSWISACVHHLKTLFRYRQLEGSPALRAAFEYRGVDLSDEWLLLLRNSLFLALWWESEIDAATAELRRLNNVQLAVVHQEFEVRGMVLIAACRRLGIPTVGTQHGTFYPLHTQYTPGSEQLDSTPVPDYFAVYGEYTKEVVSEYGSYPADRVWICAASRFDHLVREAPVASECRRRLGLPEHRRILLVTTQNYAWFSSAVRAILVSAPREFVICIKTFAPEAQAYEDLVKETGRAEAQVFVDHFEDLLGACDALVSASSTTMLEATLLGKPTVCLNFSSEPFYYPYVDEGVSMGARCAEDLAGVLQRLAEFSPSAEWHRRRREFLRRHLGPALEGGAAAAFAAHIKSALHADQLSQGASSQIEPANQLLAKSA